MKRISSFIPNIVMLFVLAACMLSCQKTDMRELNKETGPLALSASAEQLMLDQRKAFETALELTWTTGSNQGTNSALEYTLSVARKSNPSANPVVEPLGKAVLARSYTTGELNALLIGQLQGAPGEEIELVAKVIAEVTMDGTRDSAVFELRATPYEPVSETLYLVGDAAPNGWSADAATPLVASNETPGLFTWQGTLTAGEFKLLTTLGQFSPSYNRGASAEMLVLRTADDQPDDKFVIESTGNYIVTVDLLELTITIAPGSEPLYDQLWLLGDAVPTGWDIQAPTPMRVDSSNLFVFNYYGMMNAGEFKIPTATGDFNTDYFMPLENHQDISLDGMQLVPGGNPDYKWKIDQAGPYKVTLDMEQLTIAIRPFVPYTEIWMVGDASPVGWNIDNPHPMTPDPTDPYVFTYEGPMNAGEFKFPLATGNWGADFFMPEVNGAGPGSTRMKFVPKGEPDFKWKIERAGTYRIVINQLLETISIERR
ncbi:SusF/SusE family outer membrane protein [Parapedobacter soli]|uniref:SusF/SusE family outer membrane protein n=1 Tax=Parapedobacter soli TaxID=416955 RepID=UPI0021C5954D|nr:SusF/SusE family outer membrane protein [Parapedobacter soli]